LPDRIIRIEDLMLQSRVRFGTSGARGLAEDMTDEVCYAYTVAFIQYLEKTGQLEGKGKIAIGGDLRPSTARIMKAVAMAISDMSYTPENCGQLPSPAIAYYGFMKKVPTVMVTGSHIPADRNGIKYTKKDGEILKDDEVAIRAQQITMPSGLFDGEGMLSERFEPPAQTTEATDLYIKRYLDTFPDSPLKGKKIGVYQHSAVGREIVIKILKGLGAEVIPLGISDTFIPVDTEAIRKEDIEIAKQWAERYHFDCIISTDGDGDRPLIGDERGKWMRGDVAGILCSAYLKADAVVTPISSNTAVERCGLFKKVYRTRIGSPYVIEGMQRATKEGAQRVVGYEANGGFLLASNIPLGNKVLNALPTRDAMILIIAILIMSEEKGKKLSHLLEELPQRFTASSLLKEFPAEKSRTKLLEIYPKDGRKGFRILNGIFERDFGRVLSVDTTDGLRIYFESGEILHLRPSGNAPEFRCYTEADTEERAIKMKDISLNIMEGWR